MEEVLLDNLLDYVRRNLYDTFDLAFHRILDQHIDTEVRGHPFWQHVDVLPRVKRKDRKTCLY
jgi:hypothetical protein